MGGLNLGIGLRIPRLTPSEGGWFPPQSAGLLGWYDVSAPGVLFQDSAMTTPAVADGDPVAAMRDISGLNRHLLQTIGTNRRPLLRISGGLKSLQLDGVDDYLSGAFPFAVAHASIFLAVRKLSDASQQFLFWLDSGEVQMRTTQATASPNYLSRVGGTPVATQSTIFFAEAAPDSAIIATLATIVGPSHKLRRNGSQRAADAGAQSGSNYGSSGTLLYLGATSSGSTCFGGHFYGGLIYSREFTDAEALRAERYLAPKAGLSF